MSPWEAAVTDRQLLENRPTVPSCRADNRNAPVHCSRTSPQKIAIRHPVHCGKCGGMRIRPLIGSTPPSASCVVRPLGPRSCQSNSSWPCCSECPGVGAFLGFAGHCVMPNRSALVVASEATQTTGKAEQDAAARMARSLKGARQKTLFADKG